MEGVLGRAAFSVVVLTLIMLFAFLPLWREKRKKERDRKYTQDMARQYLAHAPYNDTGRASGRSSVPETVLLASRDTKGGDSNDTIT